MGAAFYPSLSARLLPPPPGGEFTPPHWTDAFQPQQGVTMYLSNSISQSGLTAEMVVCNLWVFAGGVEATRKGVNGKETTGVLQKEAAGPPR